MAAITKPKQSLSLPLKTKIQLKLLNVITDVVRRNDGTVNRSLMNFLDRPVTANPKPLNGVSTHDVTVDPTKKLWFRLFAPRNAAVSSLPIIVFFHGGGFAFMSAASYAYDAVCRRFARNLNAVVVSVDYRLAPEHKFPSQYDDGLEVLKFLDENRREIDAWPENADVTRCFLAGDSAGGNLAHNVAVRSCRPTCGAQFQFSELRVIGLINIQPFFGGKDRVDSEIKLEGAPIVSITRTSWMWKAFLPDGLGLDHWAVDVSGPNAVDISGVNFPATILFTGGFDPLKDFQRKYYEWLKRMGKEVKLVEYPNAIHAFYLFPELPQSSLLFAEVKSFIEKQSNEKAR